MNIPNIKRWFKSLNCDHFYRLIHRFHVPDTTQELGHDTYYLMCHKCGKVIEVGPEKFLIIKERQKLYAGQKHENNH